MKTPRKLLLLLACVSPLTSFAAPTTNIFFRDDFTQGSTLNSAIPVYPTTNSTSYELMSSKTWVPAPSIAANDLKFGIAATTAGHIELQALFATNAVALVENGNFIRMTVVFTNTTGLATAVNTFLGFGLYNSGQVLPFAGGLNGTAVNSSVNAATGGAQTWQGYWAQVVTAGTVSRLLTRPPQTGPDNRNQDLITTGSGSQSYGNPGGTVIGGTTNLTTFFLTNGLTYTEVFMITLNDDNSLAITNFFYAGPDTNGTLMAQFGGVATNTTFLTAGFDALCIGWRHTANQATTMDISSILVDGVVTPITGPPDITLQPVPTFIPNGGSGAFFAQGLGFNVSYQWKRYGTNLVDGGNIAGSHSDTLILSPVGPADLASGPDGYSVTISGAGGFSTNSSLASLAFRTPTNLTWSAGGPAPWDLNNSASWVDPLSTPTVFNFGDPVTFDDSSPAKNVTITGKYLSAASVTVNNTLTYIFNGTGSYAGPGKLDYIGSGQLTINNANTYTGGTLISNASAKVFLNNYNGLGRGPITAAKAGAQIEVVPVGSASVGIAGSIIVADDFTIQFDPPGSFSGVIFGELSGTPGKTLTFTPNDLITLTNRRYRVYGTNTVFDANLLLRGVVTTLANYEGTALANYGPIGSQTYNGVISGEGGFVQRAGSTTIFAGQNTYAGGTYPTTGTIAFGADTVGNVTSGPIGTGPLFIAPELPNTTGSGTVLAWGGARTIANPLQYPSATNNHTLIIGGTNNITFSGPYTLNGNDGIGTQTNRILQVGNTALTTFTGVISDGGGPAYGLVKTGNGILALDNTETYTGATSVSNGTLRVNGQVGPGPVTVGTNATLGGNGTITGPVTIQPGGILSAGASIGNLNVNNNLAINGNVLVEVNKSVSPSNDVVTASGTLNNGGTGRVTITNLGPDLVVGDSFKIFNKAVGNGNNLSIVNATQGVNWNNNLAVDGTISVGGFVTNPVIATVSATTTTVSLSGNSGTAGFRYFVLASTNALAPVSSWTRVFTNTFGAGGSFSATVPVNVNDRQRFYLVQVP